MSASPSLAICPSLWATTAPRLGAPRSLSPDDRGLPTVVAGVRRTIWRTGQLGETPAPLGPHARTRRLVAGMATQRPAGYGGSIISWLCGVLEVPAGGHGFNGRWVRGLARAFQAVRRVARPADHRRDLGPLVDGTRYGAHWGCRLRHQFDLADASNPTYRTTGTQPSPIRAPSNDTTLGWYHQADEQTRHQVRVWHRWRDVHWTLMRLIMNSVADGVFPRRTCWAWERGAPQRQGARHRTRRYTAAMLRLDWPSPCATWPRLGPLAPGETWTPPRPWCSPTRALALAPCWPLRRAVLRGGLRWCGRYLHRIVFLVLLLLAFYVTLKLPSPIAV